MITAQYNFDDFERIAATGEARCDMCITPKRLEKRIVEAHARGENVTDIYIEDLAESVCGRCQFDCGVTAHSTHKEVLLLCIIPKPERRRRRKAA